MSLAPDTPGTGGSEKIPTSPEAPSQLAGSGSTRELFQQIGDVLAKHPGLEANSVGLLTSFIFAVLFPECWGTWPFVSIVATDSVASTHLLRTLEGILPQSLHVCEISLAGILSLPGSPGQVLLIDQPMPSKELGRVLRLMSRRGARVPWKGQLVEPFRPVVLCTAEPPSDPWLQDLALQIVLMPSRSRLPRLELNSLEEISGGLRGKLVEYRDKNLEEVRKSEFDAPELGAPTRDIAALLGNSLVGDADLQAWLASLLRSQDGDARVRRMDSLRAIVVEAGLFLCHEPQRTEARVAEFATIVNGILRGREETIQLKPRPVGDLLRSVGLFPERLGAAGRGIRFTREARRKIHEAAWAFNVRSLFDQTDRCEHCKEMRARFGDAA